MILVTGGLGFLGSHIAISLITKGHDIVIVDNLSNSNLQILKRLEYIAQKYIAFVKVDLRNTPALIKVLESYPITAVIHAAGFKSLAESVIKPLEYYNANVSCIMSLFRAMQQTGIRTCIYLSSLQVYGRSSLNLTEDTVINYAYDNPYIRSQQMVEQIIQDTFITDNEWKITILRVGNVVGAFEHAILGEMIPPFPKNIVSLALQASIGIRENIELKRCSSTQDFTVERSFVHVLDLCSAVEQSLKWLSLQSHILEIFNIGGYTLSIIGLIQVIENVTGQKINAISHAYDNFHELAQIGTQSIKAKESLSWQAKRTIQQMISDQWQFYNQVLNGR
ncbi:UDP-glucose 4-epimerase [Acinetobacter sp. ANC 4558]|uniref:NAD-dependent epimerase/dehydratase family protein n=1 Tax=Acinetobacter sp. ANC 4558 TaxID=1977876 RepID=UPI000A344EBB|nr:NAD-dependent epimerase/dehydratase family protein [Acinetobacter sp. ANC 4558]OTG87128.1 UDP-glucose 4-epimerase [Acinetobacter sp. ANC 4558]